MAFPHSCPISLTTNGLTDIFFFFSHENNWQETSGCGKTLEIDHIMAQQGLNLLLKHFCCRKRLLSEVGVKRSGCLLQISSRKQILPGSSQTFSLDSPQPHPILSWSKCPPCACLHHCPYHETSFHQWGKSRRGSDCVSLGLVFTTPSWALGRWQVLNKYLLKKPSKSPEVWEKLYKLPRVAMIKYSKLGDYSGSQKSEIAKVGFFWRALRKGLYHASLLTSGGCWRSWTSLDWHLSHRLRLCFRTTVLSQDVSLLHPCVHIAFFF